MCVWETKENYVCYILVFFFSDFFPRTRAAMILLLVIYTKGKKKRKGKP
jgi:hypothetical protein